MLILGVESSCDETGVALYDSATGLLAHRLHSQVEMHRAYGGVVPELASRDHIRRVIPLTELVLKESVRSLYEIDAIAVTQGPGLGGALLVGTSFAVALGAALNKPVIGIHHLEGHLLSPLLADPRPNFPFVALLVSGGHTQLMAVRGVGKYELLGETLDDAAGEAFDKTASLLGLSYPGGPALAELAEKGVDTAFKLPRPMLHSGDLEFSFSGLKTAVLTQKQKLVEAGVYEIERANLAASFEAAIVAVLIAKSIAALKLTGMDQIVVAGGVGANRKLRQQLVEALSPLNARAYFPPLALCTDNGAMIAFAAALRLEDGLGHGTLARQNCFVDGRFTVKPRWALDGLAQ